METEVWMPDDPSRFLLFKNWLRARNYARNIGIDAGLTGFTVCALAASLLLDDGLLLPPVLTFFFTLTLLHAGIVGHLFCVLS